MTVAIIAYVATSYAASGEPGDLEVVGTYPTAAAARDALAGFWADRTPMDELTERVKIDWLPLGVDGWEEGAPYILAEDGSTQPLDGVLVAVQRVEIRL